MMMTKDKQFNDISPAEKEKIMEEVKKQYRESKKKKNMQMSTKKKKLVNFFELDNKVNWETVLKRYKGSISGLKKKKKKHFKFFFHFFFLKLCHKKHCKQWILVCCVPR